MKEIKTAANLVSSRLEGVLDQLPSWTDTIAIMLKLFLAIDIGVFLVSGSSTDELIAKALESLVKLAGGASQKIECVSLVTYPSLFWSQSSPQGG